MSRFASGVFWLLAALAFFGGQTPVSADPADEARTINRQVLELYRKKQFGDAKTLAERGLELCADVGDVKVFCASQFNQLLGDIAIAQGEYEKALPYYREALRIYEALPGIDDRLIGKTQFRIGFAQARLRRNEEAEAALKAAVERFGKRPPVDQDLAAALLELTKVQASMDRPEAVATARRTLDTFTAVQGSSDALIATTKRFLGAALLLRGIRQFKQGESTEAKASLIEGLPLFDPPLPGWEKHSAAAMTILGQIHDSEGRHAEAEALFLRALNYYADPSEATNPKLLAILGTLADHFDRYVPLPEKAIEFAQRIISALDQQKIESPVLGQALVWLARGQKNRREYADAGTTYLRAVDVIDRTARKDGIERTNVRVDLANLRIDQERYADAEAELRAALVMEEEFRAGKSPLRSTILACLALVYRDTARYGEAKDAVSEAIRIEEAAGPKGEVGLARRLTLLATILRREARYADAESALQRALSLPIADYDRLDAMNSLGLIYSSQGASLRARPVLEAASAIAKRVLPAEHSMTLNVETNLAQVDIAQGQFAEAIAKRQAILRTIEARASPRAMEIALHSVLLADALVRDDRIGEAESLAKRAVALNESVVGPNHPRTAGALRVLAMVEVQRGNDRNADALYKRIIAIDRKVFDSDNATIGEDMIARAAIMRRTGSRQEAKADLEQALKTLTSSFGDASPLTLAALGELARGAYEEGRFREARELAHRMELIRENAYGSQPRALVANRLFLANLNIAEGLLEAAEADLDNAQQMIEKSLPPDHILNIDLLSARADLASARGDLPGAESLDRQALAFAERRLPAEHRTNTAAVDRLIGVLWAVGKRAEVERLRRAGLTDAEQRLGEGDLRTARSIRNLALVLASSARASDAIDLYRRALGIDERVSGPASREVALDCLALSSILISGGSFDEAQSLIRRARAIGENDPVLLGAAVDRQVDLALLRRSFAEALVLLEARLKLAEQMFGIDGPLLIGTLSQLGKLYLVNGRINDARQTSKRAIGLVGNSPAETASGILDFLHFQAMLDAQDGDLKAAEDKLKRALAIAIKYGGPTTAGVAVGKFNLGIVYLRQMKFGEAIENFGSGLKIQREVQGDRSQAVGHTLLAMAIAYERKGDGATAAALRRDAIVILGPTLGARSEPNWL